MKKTALLLLALALAAPMTVSAQETAAASGKNLCLLDSENCPQSAQTPTIQEQIARLEAETQKGTAVYTAAELKILQAKIEDYRNLLAEITRP
ncbi:MAG TPA: hypothetical protein VJ550_16370 [Geomonas sp.]|nr:hypothetical protein [Geomonas sp.]